MTAPTVLIREGKNWRQYLVVSDERVAIVHMIPALLGGWNISRVDVQGSHDWPRMSRDSIVAWKFQADDGRTRVADDISPEFRKRLESAPMKQCRTCGGVDEGNTCCPPDRPVWAGRGLSEADRANGGKPQ